MMDLASNVFFGCGQVCNFLWDITVSYFSNFFYCMPNFFYLFGLQSGTCSLREAVIVGSIIQKVSIPMLHSRYGHFSVLGLWVFVIFIYSALLYIFNYGSNSTFSIKCMIGNITSELGRDIFIISWLI